MSRGARAKIRIPFKVPDGIGPLARLEKAEDECSRKRLRYPSPSGATTSVALCSVSLVAILQLSEQERSSLRTVSTNGIAS